MAVANSDSQFVADTMDLFAGPGEMRARCRAFDWGSTPLGPVAQWSRILRNTVRTLLAAQQPMFLWWGSELIQVFNDGYLPSFGSDGRDRRALGARGREHWPEIWSIIGPQIDGVMTRGESTWHEDQLVPIERNGHLEDVYWTYSYNPVFDDDGTIGGTLVICQETTERVAATAGLERVTRELELERERLAYVFHHAPSFLAVLRGPMHVFDLVNEAYYNLVGHRDLIGQSVWNALPEVKDQGFEMLLDSVLQTGVPFVGRETPLRVRRTPDGSLEERFVDFTYTPLIESSGGPAGVIAHGSDVTDHVIQRREVERLLRESEEARAAVDAARRAAVEANRAKAHFLATMSHELRTPLNTIGGYVDLLDMGLRGPVTEAQRADLARIKRSQQILLSHINDILSFARLEAQQVRLHIADVPVLPLLADVADLLGPQLREQGLTLETPVAPSALALRADRERLQHVLINLVSNAAKFTDAPGDITLSAFERDDRAYISVRDTGVGIASDQLETVFDPFVRLDPKLKKEQGGTGLGLSISRALVRAMSGELSVESTLGVGSTFTVCLPLAPR